MYQRVLDVSVFLGEGVKGIETKTEEEVVLFCMYGKRKEVLENVAGCMGIGLVVAIFLLVIGLATVGVENVIFYVLVGIGAFVFFVLTVLAVWVHRRWKTREFIEPKPQEETKPLESATQMDVFRQQQAQLNQSTSQHDSIRNIPGMSRLLDGP